MFVGSTSILGAPHVAQQSGTYCAGVPANTATAESVASSFVPLTGTQEAQWREDHPDAQPREFSDFPTCSLPDTQLDGASKPPSEAPAKMPEPSPPRMEPVAPAAEDVGESAPVTPTVPESTVPGSPRCGGKNQRSPTYWKILGRV